MALIDKISADINAALKGGEKTRLETLRTVLAALKEKVVEKRPKGGMTDEDEMTVLIQAAKKRREAADIYTTHGRTELASAEEEELKIIQEYLPKPLSPEELDAIVRKIVMETGAAGAGDFGRVMPLVMKEAKGKIDGKTVQSTVKKILEESADGAH
jgi:uncharacterized protein YqeY